MSKKKMTQTEKATVLKQNTKKQSEPNQDAEPDVVVINTSIADTIQKALNEKRLFVTTSDTFYTGIVYAYGGLKMYLKLVETLLDGDLPSNRPSFVGCYCIGGIKKTISEIGQLGIVFVDRSKIALEDAIPVFAHEISHLADQIIDSVGVKDSAGEAKAYFVQRETQKVLEFFYGKKIDCVITVEKIMDALK